MGSENLKRVNNYAIMRLQSKLNAPFNNGVVHMRTLNNETLYKIEKYINEYQIEKRLSKREARLFEKRDYVFDILGGSQAKEEDKALDALERREQEQAEAEKKQAVSVDELDKLWKAKVDEVHKKILKAAEALIEEDAAALLKAKLENKITLIRLMIENYDISVQQKLKVLIAYLEQELPKLLELQEQAKTNKNYGG